MDISRRDLATGAIAGALSVMAGKSSAQDFRKSLIPDLDAMSPDTRNRLSAIVLQQALNPHPTLLSPSPVEGPNPDPDYMEFWTEARPANLDAYLSEGGDPRLYEYWKLVPPIEAELSGFGEDHFHEITPHFGEMCNPVGCQGEARAANTFVTVRAVESGTLIQDTDFYREVLDALSKANSN